MHILATGFERDRLGRQATWTPRYPDPGQRRAGDELERLVVVRGNWRDRERAIVATLEELRPDIAGLQEVWATADITQADVLAARLGMHAAYAAPSLPPVPEPDDVDLGVAVLSRWPVLRTVRHHLPSPGRADPVALLVTVDHPLGPLHVMVACLDWERDRAAQRLTQTRRLAALVTDPGLDGPLPVLLAADLNAPPDTPEIRVLTDVMLDAGPEGARTLSADNPYTRRDDWQIDQRIDYVLARPGVPGGPVVVERAFVAGGPVDGTYPSDHYAPVVDLAVATSALPVAATPP